MSSYSPFVPPAASSRVISLLINVLSLPLLQHCYLTLQSNRSSWSRGVGWCGYVCVRSKVLSSLTTNSLRSWSLLNWKDPLFWMTGWCDVRLRDCLPSAGTGAWYRLTSPGNQNRHQLPAVVRWSKEKRGLKYPAGVLRMRIQQHSCNSSSETEALTSFLFLLPFEDEMAVHFGGKSHSCYTVPKHHDFCKCRATQKQPHASHSSLCSHPAKSIFSSN